MANDDTTGLILNGRSVQSSSATLPADLEKLLIGGDLSVLSETNRLVYYKAVCQSVGLNVLTNPFEYIRLNGKLVLYAKKAAADQLRAIYKISIEVTSTKLVEGVYEVTVRGSTSDGRFDSEIGSVSVAGLKGEALANATMKAVTKAKRRLTLSMCGLGMLDETEVETIRPDNPMAAKNFQPEEGDGNQDNGYRITFGKFKGRTLEEVGAKALGEYVYYIEGKAKRSGETIQGQVADFIARCEEYIGAFENTPSNLDSEPPPDQH